MNTIKFLLAGLAISTALGIELAAAQSYGQPVFVVQGQGHYDKRQYREAREARPPRQQYAPPAPAPQYAPHPRGRGQMTEEERRQLHRDLDRANRELYMRRR